MYNFLSFSYLTIGEQLKEYHLQTQQSDFVSHYRTVINSTLAEGGKANNRSRPTPSLTYGGVGTNSGDSRHRRTSSAPTAARMSLNRRLMRNSKIRSDSLLSPELARSPRHEVIIPTFGSDGKDQHSDLNVESTISTTGPLE